MATKRTPRQVTRKGEENSSDGPVKVWSDLTITLQLREYESVKFTHGQQRYANNDTETEILRVEEAIHASCEKIINKRVKKYARLIRQLKEES